MKTVHIASLSRAGTCQSPSRTLLCLAAGAACSLASLASAQDITNPGDPITPSSTNHPPGEPPTAAIDNNANSKYLNFDRVNTGFTVTPSGTGIVRGLGIITANDAPERDPTSFLLEGSNDGVNFTAIASGPLNPSTARRAFESVRFNNTTAYTTYRVTFPTIRNAGSANSMQVAEVTLLRSTDILTAGDAFTVEYTPGASSPPNEGPAAIFDDRAGTKMGIFGGNLGPTFINVTPGVGASVVNGFNYFCGNDDLAFPGRAPQYITISGSNNGSDFFELFTTPIATPSANYQNQQFTFANSTTYTTYRLEIGPTQGDTFLQIGEIEIFGNASNAAPANDNCASAQVVTAGTVNAANFNATGADDTPCSNSDTTDVWFSYTAPSSGTVEINTIGTVALDTTLAVYQGCGGALLGCNDNARRAASRVVFQAVSGTNYRIRVAGAGSATGAFALNIIEGPVAHADFTVPLSYNFNGMVHAGEAGLPDSPAGYRSISDRGLRVTGAVGAIDVGLEGGTGLAYSVVGVAGALDIVHLGDRTTTDNGRWAFDDRVGAVDPPDAENNIGIQPVWLGCTDQSAAQVSDVCRVGAVMGEATQIGVIYNISNGGGSFDMVLSFDDGTTATATLQGPDWFGDQQPGDPNFGVAYQEKLGVYFGAENTDVGEDGTDLNVVEAIVSRDSLLSGLGIDIAGKRLASIAFNNRTSQVAGYAVYAATIRDAASFSPGACGVVATANASAAGNSGADVSHISVHVTPATSPASTGVAVTLDLSGVGGGSAVPMFDDGLHGDGAAGDNIFGLDFIVPAGTIAGTYPFNFNVSDSQGRTAAGTSCLTVFTPPPPPPENDACANAIAISDPGVYAFDTTNATPDGPAYCTGNASGSVWFSYTGPVNSVATISTCDQAVFDTVLAATDSCGGAAIACNDDTCGVQSTIVLPASNGAPVLIRVSGFGGGAGSGNIVITVEGGCRIDFNGDGDINADDLADYINCFFATPPCPQAEFNGDGDLNADDLADFINEFFAGC